MATNSMKDIKLRIRSIQSTRQITKAMQLVASSKLRRAKERMEQAAPYHRTFKEIIKAFSESSDWKESIFFAERKVKKICLCVIGGDRGLAGGYNSNVFKEVESRIDDMRLPVIILPIGRKTAEHFSKNYELLDASFATAADVGIDECFKIGKMLADGFLNGEYDDVYITYTHYKNVLHHEPITEKLLPLKVSTDERKRQIECDTGFSTAVESAMPSYLASVIYTAVAQSYVSELTSRQNAMDTATSNADEMLSELRLQYNRARQAGITQELTEIVAGANS